MFKAKLITNFNYYQFNQIGLILSFITIMFIVTFMEVLTVPFWLVPFVVVLGILAIIISKRIESKKKEAVSGDTIELGASEIKINYKEGEAMRIPLTLINKITVRESYEIPGDSIRRLFNEIKGKQHKNFIIIEQGEERKRFDFVIDSYYAIEQINKVVDIWFEKEMIIEKI